MTAEMAIFPGVRVERGKRKLKPIRQDVVTNLQIVWTGRRNPYRRLIARVLEPGGVQWGVWDRKTQRFLTEGEIAAKTEIDMREEWNCT